MPFIRPTASLAFFLVLPVVTALACGGDDPLPRTDGGGGGDTGVRIDGGGSDMMVGPRPDAEPSADTGPSSDWASCTINTDCMLLPDTCCETCGVPTADDYDAVNTMRAVEHRNEVCPGDPPPCLPCAPAPHAQLQATCARGRCEVLDVRAHPVSACASDADCRVRVTQCCECGGDTAPDALIAISVSGGVDYSGLVCDPMAACPECEPAYPANVTAVCQDDGHCGVLVLREG